MFRHRIAAVTLVVAAATMIVRADEPLLEVVLQRAAAYVIEFQRQLSGIVAEETYTQSVRSTATGFVRGQSSFVPRRELKSDLLLVRPEGGDRWIQFRDVFEVDGQQVRDRNERLMKLFLQPSSSSAKQAEQIVAESSRYNIGNVQRTINVPVLALIVLDPRVQRRFTFRRTVDAKPKLDIDGDVPADTWVVQFNESERGTIIRTTNNRDLPSHGRFWIEPATGRVLMSELIAEDLFVRGTVVVGYHVEPAIGLLVPAEMRERYDVRRNNTRVDGTATYGRFRQFQVKVDEKIAPIKE